MQITTKYKNLHLKATHLKNIIRLSDLKKSGRKNCYLRRDFCHLRIIFFFFEGGFLLIKNLLIREALE